MHRRLTYIFFLLVTVCGACQEKIDIPPAPIAPPIEDKARTFNQATGTLNTDDLELIGDWINSSGGLGTISLMLISDFLLLDWLGNLSQNEMNDDPQLLEEINLEGWARLTLPCPGGGGLVFNLLLDQMGIFPVIWGTLESCHYPELSLMISGELTLFLPTFADFPIFSRGDWGEDEANGMWLELKGSLSLGEVEGQTDQILMVDGDTQMIRTLWEDDHKRFILSMSDIDWSHTTLDDLESLSLILETEDTIYRCQVSDSTCTQVVNED